MALLVMDGFEFAPTLRSTHTVAGGISAATGRDGVGKSISMTGSSSVTVPLPSLAAVVVVGVGIWIPSGVSTTVGLVSILGDVAATTHLSLTFDSGGHIVAKRGTGSGTVLATGPTAIAGDAWHWLEMKATIADSGGVCIVKVDGTTEINFTGDTKNAGTLTTISHLAFAGASAVPRFDDLVICDATGSAPFNDFFGEKVIKIKRPSNNGATNQWVGSDGNSTDNYLLVDDPPPVSSADYTGSATATERDLYAMSSAAGLASVDAIQNIAYVAKSDAGARSFKTVTRNAGGTVTSGPTVALSTTYLLAAGAIELTDPSAAAWTPSNVNTIQAGVECV